MKKYIALLSLVLVFICFASSLMLVSCEKPSDCVESTGEIITKDISVTPFNRIEVLQGIELIITQGPEYKVQIQTGENLMENIEVTQNGNILILKDNATCNWVRDFGQTKVYVTAPNLEEIYSKTEKNISSNGVLTYPTLRLFALDSDGDGREGAGTGDFFININNASPTEPHGQLVIQNNNVARYFISGQTDDAIIDFYAGDGRLEAPNLTIQTVKVFHRGSNDMILKPIQRITGKMVSTGDIILKSHPTIVDVEQLYQGHVIYN
jgi:hypothetical protein